MALIESIILGVIQGITEWLPVSSEGISSLVMVSFFGKGLGEAIFYSLWLHLGTLLAAVVYFRKDINILIKALPDYLARRKKSNQIKENQNNLLSFLIISTIISGIIGGGLIVYGVEKLNFLGEIAMAVIGAFLIITGILQFSARKKKQLHKEPTKMDSLILGLVQSLSVFPGLSRSGLTVSALLFRSYDSKQALKLSFLMSIPLVLVAQVGLGLMGKISLTIDSLVAVAVAFVVGLLSINVLMKVAERINFGWFCIVLGIVAMVGLVV